MVGKSGKYDESTKTLTYEILLNPEACRLNEGDTLTVKDILAEGALKGHIELKSLKLFSTLKTVDSNYNTKIESGKIQIRTIYHLLLRSFLPFFFLCHIINI